jgi:hypothetical protein
MSGDRRKPVARYVLFADGATQEQFAGLAEATYQDMARRDQWSGKSTLELSRTPTATTRRVLLRRAAAERARAETLDVTSGLAAAGETGRDVPGRVATLRGCEAERTLAETMGRVVLDLVRDLAGAPVDEQRAHPAYRQTLRLAAELQTLHAMLVAGGCRDPFGCVRARPPEQWGRREEDVEVAEVRAVLLEIAEDTAAHRS